MSIPERDWRQLRQIKEKALDRYCQATLEHIREISDSAGAIGNHKAYLEIYSYIADRDELLSILFDDWRRSNARLMIMGWATHGLMTETEFAEFSDEMQALVKAHTEYEFIKE